MMLEEIEKTRTDTRILGPYAPIYIMLPMNKVAVGKNVSESGDQYEDHKPGANLGLRSLGPSHGRVTFTNRGLFAVSLSRI